MQERIKQLRNALGMTQTDFGDRIETSTTAVSFWERGENVPDNKIKLICNEYNVNEDWLRSGKGAMFVNAAKEVERLSDEELISELNNRGYVAYLNQMDGWQTVEFVGAGF